MKLPNLPSAHPITVRSSSYIHDWMGWQSRLHVMFEPHATPKKTDGVASRLYVLPVEAKGDNIIKF